MSMVNGIEDQLIPQEYILWQGQPTRLALGIKDYSILLAGVILFSLPVFIMFLAKDIMPVFGYFFMIVFMGLSAYFFFGRVYKKYRAFRNSYYAITNVRIIIYKRLLKDETFACNLSDVDMIEKHTKPSTKGSILFRTKPHGSKSGYYGEFNALYMIENVDDVYRELFKAIIKEED